MNYYSYVITRDYGFAPNPFGGFCTLATCKPKIRNSANINDWIFGISPKVKSNGNDLIFAMKVSLKLTYDQYWHHLEFQHKKPLMTGSLKQMYGDNIYHHDCNGYWVQANSHHSLADGSINFINLNRDITGKFVLVGEEFYYFGGNPIKIPLDLKREFSVGRGHKKVNEKFALQVIDWLKKNEENGYLNDPKLFNKFIRYNGQ